MRKSKVCIVAATGPLFVRNVLETGALDVLTEQCDVIGLTTNEVPVTIPDNRRVRFMGCIPISRRRAAARSFCRYLSMWHHRDRSSTFAWKFVADLSWRRRLLCKLLSLFGLAEAIISVVEKFLRSQSELESALNEATPDLMIIFSACSDTITPDILKACHKRGIPTLMVINGWDNISSYGVWTYRPDRVAVWGEQNRECVIRIHRMVPQAVEIIGVPHFCHYYEPPANSVSEIRQALGLPNNGRVALFAGGSRQIDEISHLLTLDKAIHHGQLPLATVIYRPHPWRKPRQEPNFFEQRWRHVIMDPRLEAAMRKHLNGHVVKPHHFLPSLIYARDLLSIVELVICPLSTFMVEAAVMGKPVLVIATADGGHVSAANIAQCEHFKALSRQPGFRFCRDAGNSVHDVAALLDLSASERYGISAAITRIAYHDDRLYAQRLWDVVKPLLHQWRDDTNQVEEACSTAVVVGAVQ